MAFVMCAEEILTNTRSAHAATTAEKLVELIVPRIREQNSLY